MALHWNVGKCADYKELIEGDEQHVTNAVVFLTMAVGMSSITKKNADAFAARVAIWQQCVGASLSAGAKPLFVTKEDVRRRVGLGTNADSKTMTRFLDDAARAAQRAQESDNRTALAALDNARDKEAKTA